MADFEINTVVAEMEGYNDDDAMFEEDLEDIPDGLRVGDIQPDQNAPVPVTEVSDVPPAHEDIPISNIDASLASAAPITPAFNQPPTTVGAPPTAGVAVTEPTPLPPLVPEAPLVPVKRPRGRPRKIPGTESRPRNPTAAPRPQGTGPGRPRTSRPRTSVAGRGRSGKPKGKGKRKRDSDDDGGDSGDSEDEGENGQSETSAGPKVLNMQEEMPDDFDPSDSTGPTTKFGRKISKPQPFVPTNKPTAPRKKRPSNVTTTTSTAYDGPDANLMCEVCHQGHSPEVNRLVICESCGLGWHQICHNPPIAREVVNSDLNWLCKSCDMKLAMTHPRVDVNEGVWTAGIPPYTFAEKKEWLETLPLHSLIQFVLSIEQKYCNRLGIVGFEIWPDHLPALLANLRKKRAQEAEDLRIKEERAEGTPLGSEFAATSDAASDILASRRNTLMSSAGPSPILPAQVPPLSQPQSQPPSKLLHSPAPPNLNPIPNRSISRQGDAQPPHKPFDQRPSLEQKASPTLPHHSLHQSQSQPRGPAPLVHEQHPHRQTLPPVHRMTHSHSHSTSSTTSNPNNSAPGGSLPDFMSRGSYMNTLPHPSHDFRRDSYGGGPSSSYDPRRPPPTQSQSYYSQHSGPASAYGSATNSPNPGASGPGSAPNAQASAYGSSHQQPYSPVGSAYSPTSPYPGNFNFDYSALYHGHAGERDINGGGGGGGSGGHPSHPSQPGPGGWGDRNGHSASSAHANQ
ncbi:hypothetical protein T439DRAFT_323968 [Meredithblackwellia eburnea MCA 4105]